MPFIAKGADEHQRRIKLYVARGSLKCVKGDHNSVVDGKIRYSGEKLIEICVWAICAGVANA